MIGEPVDEMMFPSNPEIYPGYQYQGEPGYDGAQSMSMQHYDDPYPGAPAQNTVNYLNMNPYPQLENSGYYHYNLIASLYLRFSSLKSKSTSAKGS